LTHQKKSEDTVGVQVGRQSQVKGEIVLAEGEGWWNYPLCSKTKRGKT